LQATGEKRGRGSEETLVFLENEKTIFHISVFLNFFFLKILNLICAFEELME
jgi:hypothetical protein